MMNKSDFLIVGGGIAGTTAAETIRSKNLESSITILTQEPERLYSRVLLPHYLRDENTVETVYLRNLASYETNKIDLKTNTRVIAVNLEAKTVSTTNGEWKFEKLLLASGGKVNRLTNAGSNLPEVVYLRTLEDAKKIKEMLVNAHLGVVIGGGFIGIELLQSFVANNLQTTSVIREKYFWENVVGPKQGELLSKILEQNGVKIVPEIEKLEFIGGDHLKRVSLGSGVVLPTDIAGVGIGIHLDLAYLKNTSLTMKTGVVVNEFLETSWPNVWAAGDVAEFFDPVFGRYHNLGNWANASAQGRAAGANMVGIREAFSTVSMYSINVFKNNFSFLGDTRRDSETEVIERGGVEIGKLSELFLRNDVVVGASVINHPQERNILGNLISKKVKISSSRDQLADINFDLTKINA